MTMRIKKLDQEIEKLVNKKVKIHSNGWNNKRNTKLHTHNG